MRVENLRQSFCIGLTSAALLLFGAAAVGCADDDDPIEDAADEVGDAIEEIGDEIEDATDG